MFGGFTSLYIVQKALLVNKPFPVEGFPVGSESASADFPTEPLAGGFNLWRWLSQRHPLMKRPYCACMTAETRGFLTFTTQWRGGRGVRYAP
jgi:hypothetical protein